MTTKQTKRSIAVLFGGRSGEHEVSLMSARSILSVLDHSKYAVTEIGITHDGVWLTGQNALAAFEQGKTETLLPASLLPDPSRPGLMVLDAAGHNRPENFIPVDVYFPVLHGTYGEDGTLQGLFEMADVAYVGASVIGSSVGMEKGVFKSVMVANNIPVVASVVVLRSEIEKDLDGVIERAESVGPYPLFIKPANLGSSVGITKCRSRADIAEGLMEAALYDRRVLIERGVTNPREIEISVLGNDTPEASIPGEVIPGADFYSYDAKYILDNSELRIPAPLSEAQIARIQSLAVRAFKAVDCCGMARVDFLLDEKSGEVFLNEINTIPGFTRISMYPKLWEASGLPYASLVDRLIELALERKADRDRTVHQFRRDQ
ncbi:MAG TPA: D-alanine--D-alanine ligase family protein [Anaerolineales bacterium]